MSQSFRRFSMSLVERLGYKTLNALYSEMSCNEIMEWAAYDLTNNPEWVEKYKSTPISLSPEKEADAIKAMLLGISNGGNR